MTDLVSLVLDAKATNVDDFAKKTLEIKDRIDGVTESAVNAAGKWGRLWMVASMIPGVSSAMTTGFKAVSVATAGVTAGLAAMTVMTIRAGARLTDLSNSTNALRDDLQAMRFVAEGSGTPLASLHDVFLSLAQAQGEFNAGIGRSTERIKAFQALGITLDDLRSKNPNQIFRDMVARLGEGVVSTEKMAAGVKLFGSGFRDVVSGAKQDMAGLLAEWEKGMFHISDVANEQFDSIASAFTRMIARMRAEARHFPAEMLATIITGAKAAIATVGIIPATLFPNISIPGVGPIGEAKDKAFSDAYRLVTNDSGSQETERLQRVLQDKTANRDREKEVSGLKSQIRALAGDEFDIDFEEMDERGARADEFSRLLRRIQRRKPPKDAAAQGQETGQLIPGFQPDALARIGLFRGGTGGVMSVLAKQERKLGEIHKELVKQTTIATKED